MTRRRLGSALALIGLGLALLPLLPSPKSSVSAHLSLLALRWAPALLALAASAALLRRRWLPVLWLALPLFTIAALWHPVCDSIADSEVPSFETVRPLAERAAAGEAFRELDGHWYQCKSWISRLFFF